MTTATSLLPGLSSNVATIMVLGVANVTMIALVEWTLLLYMNHISFTTLTSATFYIRTTALSLIVPIFANVALGHFSARFGAGRVHAYGNLVVVAGLVVIVVSRNSRFVFLLAYTAYSVALSFRILRISMLSDVVPRKHRTSIMGAHQLCIPLGLVFGPIIWLAIQKWQGSFRLPAGVVADRFSANYALCAVIMFACCVLAMTCLTDLQEETEAVAAEELVAGEEDAVREQSELLEGREDGRHGGPKDAASEKFSYGTLESTRMAVSERSDPNIVSVQYSDGRTLRVSLDSYKRHRFCFYAVLLLGVRMSTVSYAAAFQPIMVDVFQVSEERLTKLYLLVAFLALLPPIIVAVMSHVMSDRTIVLIGLSLKTVGIALMLPVGGRVTEWRFVGGFILIAKASMFLIPAAISLFTKVLGRMSTAALIGWLWSAATMGPAVVQVVMSKELVDWFGGWAFGAFGLPALAVIVLVLSPYGWRMIDQNDELTRLVVREVDRRKVGESGVKNKLTTQ